MNRAWRIVAAGVAIGLLAAVLLFGFSGNGGGTRPPVPATVVATAGGSPFPSPTTPTPPPATATVVAATPTPSPTPTATAVAVAPPDEWAVERPPRDLPDLARRFGRLAAEPTPQPTTTPANPPRLGEVREFWVADHAGGGFIRVSATLTQVSEHAYFFVERGIPVAQSAIEQAATEFERTVYPSVTRHFGPLASPGVDGDPRAYFLLARLSGLAGYHSSADLYPRAVHPFSNEHEIVYVVPPSNAGALDFAALLTHEFQHLVRSSSQPFLDSWVNEGSSELAVQLAGYRTPTSMRAFLMNADTPLTHWASDLGQTASHYGAAYLFMSYFAERYGTDGLQALRRARGRGADLFDAYLARAQPPLSFDALFADWTVANFLDDPALGDGRYGYRELEVGTRDVTQLGAAGRVVDSVSQYAARYYSLPTVEAASRLSFSGAESAALLPVTAHGGRYFWWSNRGDLMDSRLTMPLNLSGASAATLRFWTWYDVERAYDYAYVAVSADGGWSWSALEGRFTTDSNPYGNSLGPGYTGPSGGGTRAGWVQEEVSLDAYVGRDILLRFEYVTDDGYNGNGFAVDDVEVPEIGFLDDAEAPGKWQAEGFVRSDGRVPQRYAVRLIRQGAQNAVEEVPVDASGATQVILTPKAGERLTLVVAATAPLTGERAPITLSLGGAPAPTRTPTRP